MYTYLVNLQFTMITDCKIFEFNFGVFIINRIQYM